MQQKKCRLPFVRLLATRLSPADKPNLPTIEQTLPDKLHRAEAHHGPWQFPP